MLLGIMHLHDVAYEGEDFSCFNLSEDISRGDIIITD